MITNLWRNYAGAGATRLFVQHTGASRAHISACRGFRQKILSEEHMSKSVAKHGAAVLTFDLYHEASRWGKRVSITSKPHPWQHLVGPKGAFVKLHKSQPVGLQVGTSTTCGAMFALTLKTGNAQDVESVWRWDAGQGSMQKDYK
ncbi:hypothetical protein Efla_003883 [Eimeria flavescens]